MAFSSLADLVQSFETGGIANPWTAKNYAYDATHTASGGYQITNSTWKLFAPAAGVDVSQYPSAMSAPAAVQTSVFQQIVSSNGLSDWTCPGCNAPLTNYLAANPSAASLPVVAGGTPSTLSGAATGATGAPGTTPAPGWSLTGIGTWLSAGASRVGLGALGLLLMAGALFIFANRTQIVQSVR